MKSLYSLFLGVFLLCASAFAQEAPDVLIKKVTDEVLTIVRQDKDIQNGNTKKVLELVEVKVLPHFDFPRMTALAMGRDWKKASDEQKKVLSDEFKTLLVRTYSNALTGYRDQTIRYAPLKMQSDDSEVVIKTEVLQPGGRPIQLNYSLEKLSEGWKVFDVVVAGVSLVTNYRDTFNQEVRANGVDGLIRMLVDKNKQLEVGKK